MGLFDFLFEKKDKQKAAPVRNTTNTTRSSETRRPAPSTRPQPKAPTSSSEPKSFSTNMLQGVDLGGSFKLVPLDMGIFESKDFPMLGLLASTTPELAKWLPGFDLSSPESAQKYLRACVLRTEMGLGFTYLIKFNSGVCGMIFVNTPTYNETTIGRPRMDGRLVRFDYRRPSMTTWSLKIRSTTSRKPSAENGTARRTSLVTSSRSATT